MTTGPRVSHGSSRDSRTAPERLGECWDVYGQMSTSLTPDPSVSRPLCKGDSERGHTSRPGRTDGVRRKGRGLGVRRSEGAGRRWTPSLLSFGVWRRGSCPKVGSSGPLVPGVPDRNLVLTSNLIIESQSHYLNLTET